MTQIIGLSGKARHGKGSVVQLAQIWLQKGDDEKEVRQVSFATALKTMATELVLTLQHNDPPVGWSGEEHTYEDVARYHFVDLKLPLLIADQVVELAKGLTVADLKAKGPQARKLLQFIGTEAFRKNVDDLYWVKRAAATIEALPKETQVVFVPDARFPNEADYVRKLGGEMWRVERYVRPAGEVYIELFDNGMSAEAKSHPSETALDGYKFDRTLRAHDMGTLFDAVGNELRRLGLL